MSHKAIPVKEIRAIRNQFLGIADSDPGDNPSNAARYRLRADGINAVLSLAHSEVTTDDTVIEKIIDIFREGVWFGSDDLRRKIRTLLYVPDSKPAD